MNNARLIGTGTFRATKRMRELVQQVMDSGRVSYGPLSLAFEQRFAAIHAQAYAILSNSGTSSLQVALQAMKEAHHWEGGQVIVPATTFVATPNIVLHNRLVPVFVDVEPDTYNIDPGLVERAITRETRAIIPVSLFGQPADLSAIRDIAERHGLKVLVDSCETMFVSHRGVSCGAWGDITCFSLYAAHLLVAGVGGVATTDNPEYAARMRSLVNHGLEIDSLNPGANFAPRPMLGRKFRFGSTGHSYRITEFEAAAALAQLEDWPWIVEQRQHRAKMLTHQLAQFNDHYGPRYQLPATRPENTHAWMMYPLVLLEHDRDAFTAQLNAYGIETRELLPLLNQPAFRYLNPDHFPVSRRLMEQGFYVGCHQDLSMEDMGYLVDVLGLLAWPEFQAIHAKRLEPAV